MKPTDIERDSDDAALAHQSLQLENEKLRLEIEQMKQPKSFTDRFEKFLPMLTVAVAVGGLLLSAQSFRGELKKANDNRTSELAKEAREARKPFLDRQLQQYFDASDAAAKVATAKIPADKEAAKAKFWALYWGPLAIVEDAGMDKPDGVAVVETAMINFGACLDGPEPCTDQELKQRSLLLAHQCRASVSASWDVETATLPPKPKH